MKVIAKKEMGAVDASRDTIFTDWAAVDRFAQEFVGALDRPPNSIPASARAEGAVDDRPPYPIAQSHV
jgi:hypothetical protein